MIRPELAACLANWRLVADGRPVETPTSWLMPVRRNGEPAMLKVFKPASDERGAPALLRYFDGEGAVGVLAADDAALLMERADGARSLGVMATSGQDEPAAEILAEVIARLHAPRGSPVPAGLTPLEAQFEALFRRAADHPLLTRCATVAHGLLSTQRDVLPLHGDLHHGNVLDGGRRGWLAIDPKAVVGERTYETANLLGNPWPHSEIVHDASRMQRQARLYAARLSLDVARVLAFAFAHSGLSASWDMDDGLDPGFRLKTAELLDDLAAP